MPNEFYKEYESIRNYVLPNASKFFIREEISVNRKKFTVYKFNFDPMILQHAQNITQRKAKELNNADQAGNFRTEDELFISCFRGVLAEIGAQLYLELILSGKPCKVERWDLERINWKYNTSEYDVRILLPNDLLIKCESRASMSYKTTIEEFCKRYHVIAKYTTEVKQQEAGSDLYFRPVYQYVDSIVEENKLKYNELVKNELSNLEEKSDEQERKIRRNASNQLRRDQVKTFFEDIEQNKLHLYYVSGANLKDVELYGKRSDNGQNKAEYTEPPIIRCGDAVTFHKKILNLVNKMMGFKID